MIVDELRALLTAHPFKPFSIFAGDGRAITVPHHDYACVLPMGGEIHVQQFGGKIDLVSISQITRLSCDAEASAEPSGTQPRG